MGRTTLWAAIAATAAAGMMGCNDGGGLEGDACTTTRDCSNGYQCRLAGSIGQCTLGMFAVQIFDSVCVQDACAEATDCLGDFACVDGQCRCDEDTDCGGQTCSDGVCVTCVDDGDCPVDGTVCVAGICIDGCEQDYECGSFQICNAGRCELKGCTTHRECALYSNDARAVCDTSETPPRCKIPCTHQLECNPGGADGFNDVLCAGGYCTPVGCADDAECHSTIGATQFGVRCVPNTAL